MIDIDALQQRWAGGALAPLAAALPPIVEQGLSPQRYGDLPRWLERLAALPAIDAEHVYLDRDRVGADATNVDAATLARLESALRGLHPWRKGPFELFGLHIDTEWRSDWKWSRVAPHLADLAGRRVLDVGCGNGYHCWRMRGAGATEVIGIDPTPLFLVQFAALQRYLADDAVTLLPMGIEHLPADLGAFDTVFSMGVLYHRREPLEHLQALRGALRPGGELVLETLVIDGDETRCLVPEGRYARMGNVWFIPSAGDAPDLAAQARLAPTAPGRRDRDVPAGAAAHGLDALSLPGGVPRPEGPDAHARGLPGPAASGVCRRAPVTTYSSPILADHDE
jgi:tRNA (mo5U34)-methyltransferase